MAQNGTKAVAKFYINSVEVDAPIEWGAMTFSAKFDENETQISQTSFTFVLSAYDVLKQWLNDGKVFIMPTLTIELQNNSNIESLDYYIDMSNSTENEYEYTINAPIKLVDGLQDFEDKIQPMSYGWLENIGAITQSDYKSIEYVVEDIDNTWKLLFLAVTELQLTLLLVQNTEKLAKDLKNSGLFGTIVPPAPQTTAISIAADIALSATAFAGTLAQVLIIGKDLLNAFNPPKRTAKVISLYNLINSVAKYLGYKFETEFESELKSLYYLPSNLDFDEQGLNGLINKVHGTIKGIPNVTDVGYDVPTMLNDIIKPIVNGRFVVIDNVLQFHEVDGNYWKQNSNYVIPDIQYKAKKYNAESFKTNKIIDFQTDISELNTYKKYKGTVFEVITDLQSQVNVKSRNLKGIERISIPICLGTRKEKLNAFEKQLKKLANIIDGVSNTFGGSSSFESQINSKLKLLTLTNNNYNMPKVLKYNGSTLATRNEFSAKTIWKTHYKNKSFVNPSSTAQRIIFDGVEVPMGLNDYEKIIKNPYAKTTEGKECKIIECNFEQEKDTAILNIEVFEIYAKGLKEIEIEVENIDV